MHRTRCGVRSRHGVLHRRERAKRIADVLLLAVPGGYPQGRRHPRRSVPRRGLQGGTQQSFNSAGYGVEDSCHPLKLVPTTPRRPKNQPDTCVEAGDEGDRKTMSNFLIQMISLGGAIGDGAVPRPGVASRECRAGVAHRLRRHRRCCLAVYSGNRGTSHAPSQHRVTCLLCQGVYRTPPCARDRAAYWRRGRQGGSHLSAVLGAAPGRPDRGPDCLAYARRLFSGGFCTQGHLAVMLVSQGVVFSYAGTEIAAAGGGRQRESTSRHTPGQRTRCGHSDEMT